MLVRAILTYRNPQPKHLISLSNAIFSAVTEHQLYIAGPDTDLILYSSDRVTSLNIIKPLSIHPYTKELLEKIQCENLRIRKF